MSTKPKREKKVRKTLAELPYDEAGLADPANRDSLKLFTVKRNSYSLVNVAARNRGEARVAVYNGAGKVQPEPVVHVGRAKAVEGVVGAVAYTQAGGE